MQKLNSKTNAAGWVPTGFNRTAGSFAGAGVPGQPGGGGGKGGGVPEVKYQAMSKAAKAKAIAAAAAAAAKDNKDGENDDIFYSIFPVENEELAYGRWVYHFG